MDWSMKEYKRGIMGIKKEGRGIVDYEYNTI
jgi:hypothetical protein